MTVALANKELFGGAITTYVPTTFIDISQLREVPDNQEVYVDTNTDQSVIVELLELAEEAADADCASYHFKQIAEHNDASAENQILKVVQLEDSEVPNLPKDAKKYLLVGRQTISKYNESDPNARNVVNIYLAVFRIPKITTDIIVSYNHPVVIGPTSSSRDTQAGSVDEVENNFKKILASFNINDWSLFC
ncbi:Ran GTPase binding protein [Basidiobolus meristosporus CBS 931.73]|uniref:Ran GTPase binding protein n=1 Tax=Basidiobolus meristosporus CBS 931.73 TaxID=1314790 RepID=A0A1Y1Y0C3_9FUNG|nr:Ran GTPase binding protein [Basidiobolus meristosporus CBS 931.73]|eukprot:ORX91419.1 Ran GTPase binding protein [Basidiobolus meristosporus CBS 931.73]